MKFIADLHIHSRYSIATSSLLIPEMLDLWARKKGITVVGTGDAVHPQWRKELKEKLQSAGNGLYKLKDELRIKEGANFRDVYFMLTAEISCIYKKDGKVRKVHNVIAAPDFSTMDRIAQKLDKIGNVNSDGRPILGLDSRDLLEIVLDSGNNAFLYPAHIWTPWFSVLGSKSGFDTIEECYGDLSDHIFALETGLSSDPSMNWRCSFLDRFSLISNSDAHSPENLGREANLFNTEMSFDAIVKALKRPGDKGFLGTIEFFPEQGKYHFDGHRKCNVRWEPSETRANREICPVCGKKVTVGVLNRVFEIADRAKDVPPVDRIFYSMTPLKNLLSELCNTGAGSKKVDSLYHSLISKFDNEFSILIDTPIGELSKFDKKLSEGIKRLRSGNVTKDGGYDGVFGSIIVL